MADGTIKILTELATDGLKKGLSAATKMIAGAAASLGGLGAAAIKVGSQFEAAMSRVKAISGATEDEFKNLNELAKQLGADTAFSASEAAAGMENLASAGFSATEIMSAMPGMLDLAAVSGGDVAAAADVAASALNAFGLEAGEAAHVANVFARAAADTNAEALDMGEAMKYVGPVAKAMGISIEETAAAIGIMSDAGIKGGQAGTALRGALSRLSRPTKQMTKMMDALGVSFYDAEGNMLPLRDQVAVLQKSFAGLTQEERNNALVTLYGQESLSGMLALIEAGPDELGTLTQSLKNSDGAAEDMAQTMQDNLAGAMEELSGSAETLGLEIYESVQEPLKELAQEGTAAINDLVDAFKKGGLPKMAEEAGNVLATVVKEISSAAPKLVKAATACIKGLLSGIRKNLPQIVKGAMEAGTALVEGLLDILPELVSAGAELLAGLMEGFAGALPELIPAAINGLVNTVIAFLSNLDSLAECGVRLVAGILQGVVSAVPTLVEGIGRIIQSVFGSVSESANAAYAAAEQLAESHGELLESVEQSNAAFMESESSINAAARAAEPMISRLQELEKKSSLTNQEQEEWKGLLLKLQDLIPDISGLINDETLEIEGGARALRDKIKAWKNYAMAEAYAARAKEQMDALIDAEEELTAAKEAAQAVQSSYTAHMYQADAAMRALTEAGYSNVNSLRDAIAIYEEMGPQYDAQAQRLRDLQFELNEESTARATLNQQVAECQTTYDGLNAEIDNYYAQSQKYSEIAAASEEANNRITTGNNRVIESWDAYEKKVARSSLNAALSMIENGGKLDEASRQAAGDALAAFTDLPEDLKSLGKETLLGMIEGFRDKIPGLEDTSEMSAEEIVEAIKNYLGIASPSKVMRDIGANTMEGLKNGIDGEKKNVVSLMSGIGKSMSDGMKQGLTGQISSLVSTAASIAKQVTGAFKAKLEIHSPSRLMAREIGKPLAQGIGVGFEGSLRSIVQDMQRGVESELSRLPAGAAKVRSDAAAGAVSGAGPVYYITNHVESPVPVTVEESARLANRATEDTLFKLGVYGV